MAYWDIGLRHIVDVDGQLLAIDAEVIDTTSLLTKADRPAHLHLWQVRAGERFRLQPRQLVRLSCDEVLFFETSAAIAPSMLQGLAA
ncbi:hypothetical protein E2493_02930 [Sphingomonas parva]|uniref:Uncharacterized protein n=1 Tax=Sphingomonas parva TaxID=2555898 RepID=A0A4Y8ZX69_9SPHN|nr:hypothetical protein [Sphingomonas parva]TFI59805.1 hypothetical protein E2493_02930 [Sphingomonas parva]